MDYLNHYIRMDKISLVKRKIEEVIKGSSVPEDPVHSKNTLEWLLKLKPDADENLEYRQNKSYVNLEPTPSFGENYRSANTENLRKFGNLPKSPGAPLVP